MQTRRRGAKVEEETVRKLFTVQKNSFPVVSLEKQKIISELCVGDMILFTKSHFR